MSPAEELKPEERARAILAALKGQLPALDVPIPYRIGLFLATVMMVLLPLVYVGLIAAASYGVYLESQVLYKPLVVESRKVSGVVIYFGLMISGVVMIVFMIKPLFAPRAKKETPRKLSPRDEPLLFAFVERLCQVVGAPNLEKFTLTMTSMRRPVSGVAC